MPTCRPAAPAGLRRLVVLFTALMGRNELERSFGWRGVRALISRVPVAPVQVMLWVPGVPSPAMALLARAVEAEGTAAG